MSDMIEAAAPAPEQPHLSVAARLGNLLVAAPIEAGIAYLALGAEVTPHTPGDYVRDILASAIAFVVGKGAIQDVRSAFTGRGEPAFRISRPAKSEATEQKSE